MPRRSSSSVSVTSGTSESNIVFFAAGGHNHDGSNSSLIDASKYSIFDFDQGFLRTNTERSARQDRNRILFEDTIREIFRTAGVELGENVISAQNIIAGTITANELAANTIVADNIAANTITSNELALNTITAANLSNTITLTSQLVQSGNYIAGTSGWAIYSNGYSEFGNGNFRGNITATGGTFTGKMTAGLTEVGNNIRGATNYAGIALRNDSWDNAWVRRNDNTVYFRAGSSTRYIQIDTITGGTNAIVFPNFSVDNGGNMSASNASISGAISGGTIDIGGSDATSFHVSSTGNMWLGNASYSSAPFRVSSGGALVATSANITGAINATSGTFSGTITANGTISGGTITGATITGSTLTTSGTRNVSISTNQITLNNAGGEASEVRFIPGTQSSYGIITSDARLRLTSSLGGIIDLGITPTGGISIDSGSTTSAVGLITGFGSLYVNQQFTTITGFLNPSYYAVRIGELYSKAGIYVASGDMNIVAGGLVKIRGGGNDPITTFVGINSNADLTCNAFTAFGTKNFRIEHPILDGMDLVHSSIEGPKVDLIYRGQVQLSNGKAIVNIDEDSKMTDGTFVELCKNVQCYTTNESDWDSVRGRVEGNILIIESQNLYSNSLISWMVIGTRKDRAVMDVSTTNSFGDLLVEVPRSTRYN